MAKKCLIKRRNLPVVLSVYDNVRGFLTQFNSKALARLENFGVSDGWSHMEAPLCKISP